MMTIKHLILPLLILSLIACQSNPGPERSESDEELIEALVYHHKFKVNAIISDLQSKDNIDKLIYTERGNGKTQWTPLCFAAFIGNRQAVAELIEHGANINFKDNSGQSPIILAAIAGNPEEIKLLLKNGANINDTDRNNSSPLKHAATDGNIETVKLLVEAGCKLNMENGQNALDFARFHQETEVVEYLEKLYK